MCEKTAPSYGIGFAREKEWEYLFRCVLTGITNKEYTGSMAKAKKKKKKAKKENAIKVILSTDEETAGEEEDIDGDDDYDSGMYLEKEDVQLIYKALKEYKPVGEENNLHGVLLEEFEELLVVDFGVRLPGFEFMDDEEN
jgi:hypothetical protein